MVQLPEGPRLQRCAIEPTLYILRTFQFLNGKDNVGGKKIYFSNFRIAYVLRLALSMGQGELAKACISERIPCQAFTVTDAHAKHLELLLTEFVLGLMKTEGSSFYRAAAAGSGGGAEEQAKRKKEGDDQEKKPKKPKTAPKKKQKKAVEAETQNENQDEQNEDEDEQDSDMPW